MPSLPSSIALTSIADGASVVAADHRNNYTAVQSATNALIAALAVSAKGDMLVAPGSGQLVNLPVGANGLALVADSTQANGVKWAAASGTTYRKTTAKTVNTTVAATDLLNGEVTVAANAIGATGTLRLTAWGDLLGNSGTNAGPRLQLLLGGTTLLDTGTGNATLWAASATRGAWRLVSEIQNANASSQTCTLAMAMGLTVSGAGSGVFTTGTGAYIPAGNSANLVGANSGLAVDTTSSRALVLNIILPIANASIEFKLFGALVEIV